MILAAVVLGTRRSFAVVESAFIDQVLLLPSSFDFIPAMPAQTMSGQPPLRPSHLIQYQHSRGRHYAHPLSSRQSVILWAHEKHHENRAGVIILYCGPAVPTKAAKCRPPFDYGRPSRLLASPANECTTRSHPSRVWGENAVRSYLLQDRQL